MPLKKIINSTSLRFNIAANMVGNIWTALMNIIFIPYYLQYLGAEGYGLIGIFASLQVVLNLLDGGLSATINRELSKLSVSSNRQSILNLLYTLENVYWLIAILVSIIALGLSPLIANYWVHPQVLSLPEVKGAFYLLSFSLLFSFSSTFYNGALLGLQRHTVLNIIRIVFAVLKPVGALLCLHFIAPTVIVFFSWNVIQSVLYVFVMRQAVWKDSQLYSSIKISFDFKELKRVARFAFGMTSITIVVILLTQIDKFILSKMLSLKYFGYYTMAYTIANLLYQLSSPVSQSYFPKFSSLAEAKDIISLKKAYHIGCQLVSILIIPATLMLVFFSKDLLLLWTRNIEITENAWLPTSIFAIGVGINGLMTLPYMLTLAYGWTQLGFYVNVVMLVLMIPLIIILTSTFGIVGGSSCWAIINSGYFFIYPYLIHKKLLRGECLKWYFNDIAKPFAISLSVVALFRLLVWERIKTGQFFDLLSLTILGLVALLLAVWVSADIRVIVNNYILKVKTQWKFPLW